MSEVQVKKSGIVIILAILIILGFTICDKVITHKRYMSYIIEIVRANVA